MVAATVRTIFEQSDRAAAAQLRHVRHVCDVLATRFPTVVQLVENGLIKELKLRSAVVGIFANRQAMLRLFCALPAEHNDEWLVGQHRYFSEASMAKILNPTEDETARRYCWMGISTYEAASEA